MIYTQPVVYELPLIHVPTLFMIGEKDTTAIGKGIAPLEVRAEAWPLSRTCADDEGRDPWLAAHRISGRWTCAADLRSLTNSTGLSSRARATLGL